MFRYARVAPVIPEEVRLPSACQIPNRSAVSASTNKRIHASHKSISSSVSTARERALSGFLLESSAHSRMSGVLSIPLENSSTDPAQVCKAFANPTRLHILKLLGRRERSAAELPGTLGVSKANLSRHVGILRSTGAVITRRKGKQLFCALAFSEIRQICLLMRKLLRRLRSR